MRTNIYTIYDTVAQFFNKPFTEFNDSSATRLFVRSMADEPNRDDYVLYHIGEFNDANGELKPNMPTKIYSGLDIKNQEIIEPLGIHSQLKNDD